MYAYILINSIFPFCRFFPKFHFSSSFLCSQHFDFLDLTAPIALEIENMCKNGNVRLVPNIYSSQKYYQTKRLLKEIWIRQCYFFFCLIINFWQFWYFFLTFAVFLLCVLLCFDIEYIWQSWFLVYTKIKFWVHISPLILAYWFNDSLCSNELVGFRPQTWLSRSFLKYSFSIFYSNF